MTDLEADLAVIIDPAAFEEECPDSKRWANRRKLAVSKAGDIIATIREMLDAA